MSPLEVSTAHSEGSLDAIDCEAARQLADAIGIGQDLDYSAHELTRLEEAVKRRPRDVVLERAMWTSAIVHYGRRFIMGRRTSSSSAAWPTTPNVEASTANVVAARRAALFGGS